MITPRFNLFQDDKCLTITIRAPYCSLNDLDINVEENQFIFTCKPYYLRLNLPGNIVENSCTKSSFDSQTGEFALQYEKQFPGEHFKDLQFITKFLATKIEASYNAGCKKITPLSCGDLPTFEKDSDIQFAFGFALQSHKDFVVISSEFDEVFEIDPCQVNLESRRKLRLQFEQGKFNVDHYSADFIDDCEIKEIILQSSPWRDQLQTDVKFSKKDLDFLKDVQNVEHNLSDQQITYCMNGLLDILYAYCYDRRTTFYEENSESGWNVVKVAATFCWLDVFNDPKETLICSFRRSLIYPLYRNFDLCQTVLQDLKDLIQLGEVAIIKALIELYDIFLQGDCCRYILNNLFIKDYIIYIMKWDKLKWKEVTEKVNSLVIDKQDLGLNLTEIEEGFNLHEQFSNMKLSEGISDSDDSSDEEDSSEDSDSSVSDTSDSDVTI